MPLISLSALVYKQYEQMTRMMTLRYEFHCSLSYQIYSGPYYVRYMYANCVETDISTSLHVLCKYQ